MNSGARRVRELLRVASAVGIRERRRRMPAARPPDMIRTEYALQLLDLVERGIDAGVAPVLAEIPALVASAERDRVALRQDAGEGRRLIDLVREAKRRMAEAVAPRAVEALARRFGDRVSAYQREQFGRQTRAVFGVDIFTPDRGLDAVLDEWAAANAGLVSDIPERLASEIGGLAARGVRAGTPAARIAEELRARVGVSLNRAKLIARDQVGSLYAQVTETRQRQTGVTHYIWRTVRDRRVRGTPGGAYPDAHPSHYAREGKRFAWDDPPEGGHPGEAILCRCYPEPDLTPLLG